MPDNVREAMSYGQNIEIARRRAKLTQTKLAGVVGKDQGTISAWEKDKFRPNIRDIVLISKATGTSLDQLLFGVDPDAAFTLSSHEKPLATHEKLLAIGAAKDALAIQVELSGVPPRYRVKGDTEQAGHFRGPAAETLEAAVDLAYAEFCQAPDIDREAR